VVNKVCLHFVRFWQRARLHFWKGLSSTSLDKPCLEGLSADLSAISKIWGGRSKALWGGRDFADKLCLQMQTKGCAFCRQGLSKNADKFCRRIFSRHFPPECRQTSSKMQTRALYFSRNCRQIMQTKFVYIILGTSAFWFVYRRSKVCLQTS